MTRTVSMALVLVAALACDRAPGDLREWRPTDHHDTETDPSPGQAPQVSGSAEPALPGLEDVTVVTWQRQCVQCHGPVGRGDGPRGTMVKARDLSDPTWQASVSDAELAQSIAKGKNAMPAFLLPPATIDGLVHLVRLLDRSRKPASGGGGGNSAPAHETAPTPAPSAATTK